MARGPDEVHRAYRARGSLPGEGPDQPPAPVPEQVLAALRKAPLPCFLYRLPALRENLARVTASFPLYHFPVKCNPHPEILRTVLSGGGGFSVRSFGELEQVLALGAPAGWISFTGWGLGPALMERLIFLGVTVNLDSAREVREWVGSFHCAPFGVRLMAGDDPQYLSAGFAREEVPAMLEGVRRSGARLAGIMVHHPHRSRTAEEMAADYAHLPRQMANTFGNLLGGLTYLNLGGGWPAPYRGGPPIQPSEVADALLGRILPALGEAGFRGKLAVEPGRAVAAECGWWASEVADLREEAGKRGTVVLATPPPAPPFALPYPVAVLRWSRGRLVEVREERNIRYNLLGITSSPLKTLREPALLPPLTRKDILVLARAGAYARTSLNLGEGQRPPAEVILGE